jgi:hypothetical protein
MRASFSRIRPRFEAAPDAPATPGVVAARGLLDSVLLRERHEDNHVQGRNMSAWGDCTS